MYSINVFLTFSLSMFGMARSYFKKRREARLWKRRLALFSVGFLLCATILAITSVEKFTEGGWITLAVTGALVALCFVIRGHYRTVGVKLEELYAQLGSLPVDVDRIPAEPDPTKPTAVVLVGSYGGLGIHTVLNAFRSFPGHFKNLVFVSVGVIDSGGFKGEETFDALRERTEETLGRYLQLASGLGIAARTATRSAPTPSRRPTCSAAGSPRSSTAACSSPARSSSTASSGTRSFCTTRRPT